MEATGDAEAVEEDFAVAGFGENVGGDDALDSVGADAELTEGLQESVEDLYSAFGSGSGDLSAAEDVAGERE